MLTFLGALHLLVKLLTVDGAPAKLGTAHIWTKKAVWRQRRRRRSRQLRPNATGKMPSVKLPVVGIGADGKTPDAASRMIEKHVCGCLVVTGLGRIILVAGVSVTFRDVQCKLLNLHAETSANGTAKLDKKGASEWILRHLACFMSLLTTQSISVFTLCFNSCALQIIAILQCINQAKQRAVPFPATVYVHYVTFWLRFLAF